LRVLVIHTTYRFKGGEDSVVFNEIKLLKSEGVQVELLQFSNEGGTIFKVLQLPFNYSAFNKTKQKINSFKPDVIHIHNLHFAGSASVIYAIKRLKTPFVVTLHNYRLLCPSATLFANGQLFTDSIDKTFPLKAIFKGVYLNSRLLTFWVSLSMHLHQLKGTWKLPNKFIALGEHGKQLYLNSKLKLNPDQIVVKPNFCYSLTSSEESKEGNYYLYVGRLSDEKGLNVLLKAFAKNELPLKIVGTGPLEHEVKGYSNKYFNINYLGSLNKENVYTLLKNASALVFPSLWYETFGMVVIEAFSTGTPVIASDLGDLKSLITNRYNGLHFNPGDESDLIEKISFFQNLSEQNKQDYRKNARTTYEEKFTPQRNAQELLYIYNSITGN
jgi:glycosyltransferase involved in cell wall biosynthesis